VANEYHQIGGKMVADIFELNGWRGYFVKGLALVLFTVFSFAGCNSATLPARHQSSRFA
jgi:hypothetical protein